jgi:hypothetical protein
MDEKKCEGFETLRDIPGRLGAMKSVCDSDPVAVWEEDGARIRTLERTIESMKHSGLPGVERLEWMRDMLKWKRSDLGRRLLQNAPSGDGLPIWSERAEAVRCKARA